MPNPKTTPQDVLDARDSIREWIKPGQTIFYNVKHVSASGMTREISLHFIEDGDIRWLSGMAAKACGRRLGKHDGVIIGGCGMDMGFALIYELGRVLYPEGVPCAGKDRCQSNDHVNHGPDRQMYGERIHRDGGYAFKSRQI